MSKRQDYSNSISAKLNNVHVYGSTMSKGEYTADAFLTNRMPVQAIEVLIEHGAELDVQDKLGDKPLKKAV